MGNVKLKDIAEALNVSTVTVSNALAGRKGVSEEVRSQVVARAKELGYDLKKYTNKRQGGYDRCDCIRTMPGTWSFFLLEHVSESRVCCIEKSKRDNA